MHDLGDLEFDGKKLLIEPLLEKQEPTKTKASEPVTQPKKKSKQKPKPLLPPPLPPLLPDFEM